MKARIPPSETELSCSQQTGHVTLRTVSPGVAISSYPSVTWKLYMNVCIVAPKQYDRHETNQLSTTSTLTLTIRPSRQKY